MAEIVSNTGPLIALASIGQFHLLQALFGSIAIPPAVRTENQDQISLAALAAANWVVVRVVKDRLATQLLREELDSGESEAIVLASEVDAAILLVDERAATRKARAIGLRTIGTLGVLLMAKDNGLLTAVKPSLVELLRNGFRMSESLCRSVLDSAGENRDRSGTRDDL